MSEEKNIERSDKQQAASDKHEQSAIDNKHLAKESPIAESELSTGTSNQKSDIPKSEIENMEVHNHPHHVTPNPHYFHPPPNERYNSTIALNCWR